MYVQIVIWNQIDKFIKITKKSYIPNTPVKL